MKNNMAQYIEAKPSVNGNAAEYSRAADGEKFFTIDGRQCNFQVKEFACHDGTDQIFIDRDLVIALQKVRDKFGATTINSGYRTPAYNAKVGGVPDSQHVYGKASDTVSRGSSPLELAMFAEALGLGGIGLYSSFTHIDTRDKKSKWDSSHGGQRGVSTFYKTIRFGSSGQYVRIAQRHLGLKDDGIFGNGTKNATIQFQKDHNLDADGVIGPATWTALMLAE